MAQLFGCRRHKRCMSLARALATWALAPRALASRKRLVLCTLALLTIGIAIALWSVANSRRALEEKMQMRLSYLQDQVDFLGSMYRARHEEVLNLKDRLKTVDKNTQKELPSKSLPSEVVMLLKNNTGTRTATGFQKSNVRMRTSFVFQLLPHLMQDPHSLQPAYHMKSARKFTHTVIGIPTVRRDKESYLMLTLQHLINGLKGNGTNDTLIVVFVGETDLEYVVKLALEIETKFPTPVYNGLIEVISPHASYYPDLEELEPTLGDSRKRFKWRTKQNLDTLFLMAYGRTKGTYFLLLEDDALSSINYMEEIRKFTATVTVSNPNWFFIEYCPIGGIGKLFRSSDLQHFIIYVQLFYNNLPIDWLLESYIVDRVCTNEKNSQSCANRRLQIRPKYKNNLFQHIGLYSSLKGKIHKIKNPKTGSVNMFYTHENPPVESIKTTIDWHKDHTLVKAYFGKDFFWGVAPKKNDTILFLFKKPTVIERYTFRSGNPEHIEDRFLNTVVEVIPEGAEMFTVVGSFDEFGLAEGYIKKELGPIQGIRLRVTKDLATWAILSEIELVPAELYRASSVAPSMWTTI